MASLRDTNHIDSSKINEDKLNNTNPVSGPSCVHSDCEGNENEVYIVETVAKEDMSLDKWKNYNEPFAAFNSGLTIPTPGRVQNKDLAPISGIRILRLSVYLYAKPYNNNTR